MINTTIVLACGSMLIACMLTAIVYRRELWEHRNSLLSVSVFLLTVGVVSLLIERLTIWSVGLAAAGSYTIINIMRLAFGRMHSLHLRRTTSRSFAVLWLVMLILTCFYVVQPSSMIAFVLYLVVCVAVASIVLVNTVDRLIATASIEPGGYSDSELPTLSLAIAARNETATLQHCLEAVLMSDYPKLEILVLDDCSQDRTAQIIRDYAHRGVRFVQGEPTGDETWLPKNKAYDKLLDESSGNYIVYMGVDVRLKSDTLRQIVGFMMHKQLDMVSVLPKRTHSGLLASVIQPMRYWWELAVPKRRNYPPVLSTLWCADRRSLIEFGGFAAVKRAIVPEVQLAAHFNRQRSYAFVRSSQQLPVTTHKSFVSQWLTAVRTRYPQLHRRPEMVLAQGCFMVLFLLGPFALLPILLLAGAELPYLLLAAISLLQLAAANTLIHSYTNPVAAWFAPLTFPMAVIVDLIALHISMWRYEFGVIEWKGRNVCEPVMHVYPSLPELPDKPTLVDRSKSMV